MLGGQVMLGNDILCMWEGVVSAIYRSTYVSIGLDLRMDIVTAHSF